MVKGNPHGASGLRKRAPERNWEYVVHIPERIRSLVAGVVIRPWTTKPVTVRGQATIIVGLDTQDEDSARQRYDVIRSAVETIIKRAEQLRAGDGGKRQADPAIHHQVTIPAAPDPSTSDRMEHGGTVASRDALHDIAEELGRQAARRHRRGYGLLEMLLGTAIMACVVLLLYWAWQ